MKKDIPNLLDKIDRDINKLPPDFTSNQRILKGLIKAHALIQEWQTSKRKDPSAIKAAKAKFKRLEKKGRARGTHLIEIS